MGAVAHAIETKLSAGLAPALLKVVDDSDRHAGHAGARTGGESHFNVTIEAAAFTGLSRLQRQRLVHALLADLGCVVVGPAHTLAAALELAQGDARIDAALLDVNLGGEPVFPIANALRARSVPMIFCTGYGQTGLRVVDRGGPVLQKPFRAADLSGALCQALRATNV